MPSILLYMSLLHLVHLDIVHALLHISTVIDKVRSHHFVWMCWSRMENMLCHPFHACLEVRQVSLSQVVVNSKQSTEDRVALHERIQCHISSRLGNGSCTGLAITLSNALTGEQLTLSYLL